MPTCETDGHVFGSRGICVMCNTPKPAEQVPSKEKTIAEIISVMESARDHGERCCEDLVQVHVGHICTALQLLKQMQSSHEPPVDEPSVMGGAVHPIPPPPTGVDRIEWHVREIQKICDALNLDPVQWLMPDLENDVPEGPSPTKGEG